MSVRYFIVNNLTIIRSVHVNHNNLLYTSISFENKIARINFFECTNLLLTKRRIRCCRGGRCNAPKKLQKKLNRITSQSETGSGPETEIRTKNFINKFYAEDGKEEEETTFNGSELKSGEEEIMLGVSPSENVGGKFVILPAKQKSLNIKDKDDTRVTISTNYHC